MTALYQRQTYREFGDRAIADVDSSAWSNAATTQIGRMIMTPSAEASVCARVLRNYMN
jgi:hypothetical protein